MSCEASSSEPPSVPIPYHIVASTSHSGNYAPERIIDDKPLDQSSRWSGAFQGNVAQYIVLKLDSLAVLKTIKFGKFSKPHPCNMKEVKIFVGMSDEHMTEVLHASLKNDANPETFVLNHVNSAGVSFPTRYVKIVPLQAHGHNFHISIWHVALAGISDQEYVEGVRLGYEDYRETAVLRYVLKHLRQRRLLSPYQSIISRANIYLEHPLITKMHESLVLQGDWQRSEQLLDELSSTGLFDSYLRSCQPFAEWTRLTGTDADGDVPPARGGHAMCMDPVNEMIYVFGGWDGEKSLDDLWVYSVREDKWKILSHSTTNEQNAPGARSCHKMVFDTKTGSIYVLGRLNDADGLRAPLSPITATNAPPTAANPTTNPTRPRVGQQTRARQDAPAADATIYSSEFYRYHTRGVLAGKWDFLSIDTAASGGPPLIFDHQMVMDSDAQMLYVFGGRVVDGDWDVPKYSGLYSYNVSTSKWKMLQQAPPSTSSSNDLQMYLRQLPPDSSIGSTIIPARFGHSMVLDPTNKILYIFAGQRDEKYLSDMYAYDIKNDIATEVSANFSTSGGPEACFTQRAVIDPFLKEIYVFCGLTRTTMSGSPRALRDSLLNWVYRYAGNEGKIREGESKPLREGKWMRILRLPDTSARERPMPRFAHQVVYSAETKMVYLHGGNAGGPLAGVGGDDESEDGGAGAGNEDNSNAAAASTPSSGGGGHAEAPTSAEQERSGEDASSDGSIKGKDRLDDFWRMELKRPGPEEIIRQAKFMIRRQQFREMCDEVPPVKALRFLQNDVASVVDHKNPAEEEEFRGLMTYLLGPRPKQSSSQPQTRTHSESPLPHPHPQLHPQTTPSTPQSHSAHASYPPSSRPSTSSSISTVSSLEHEDSREGSPRPRKRSRGHGMDLDADGNGAWTSDVPISNEEGNDWSVLEGASSAASAAEGGGSALGSGYWKEVSDAAEPQSHSWTSGSQFEAVGLSDSGVSAARYSQRTEVFEELLKFVSDDEKQPSESLLDLVERDRTRSVISGFPPAN